MSFLTQGKFARPALGVARLGFDPVALVQRALVTGLLTAPPAARPAPVPRKARVVRRPRKTPAQLMRELRARRKAAGLTREGKTPGRFNLKHPRFKGLPRREYLTRMMRLRRGRVVTGPIRPYRKAAK